MVQPEVLNRNPPDKVFLDDPFEHRFGAGVVPDAIGIDDRNRPGGAYAQAIGLGPGDLPGPGQAEFGQAMLEVFPRGRTGLGRAALGLLRLGAKEYVPAGAVPNGFGQGFPGGGEPLLGRRAD